VSLYEDRVARVIERQALEVAAPAILRLDGMTHDQRDAAMWPCPRSPRDQSAAAINRRRAAARLAIFRRLVGAS
jgi:hypothetical protein